MSLMSPITKDVPQVSHSNESPGLLFALSTTEVTGPEYIALQDWSKLPIDRRAPFGSIAMFDIVGERFTTVIIDTVADRPLWWMREPLDLFAQLYLGMLGGPGGPSRGTVVMSTPRSSPPDAALPSIADAGGPGPATAHCAVCEVFALPSDSGPTGPGGDPKVLLLLAGLLSRVGQATLVTIGNGGLDQRKAVLVRNG